MIQSTQIVGNVYNFTVGMHFGIPISNWSE
jgi:hypothetical protein